jgi:hypothetical protein
VDTENERSAYGRKEKNVKGSVIKMTLSGRYISGG